MKKYFVLEANNTDIEIYMSSPFDNQEAAFVNLTERYNSVVEEVTDCGKTIEAERITEKMYSVLLVNGDFFYGNIVSVDIPI